MYDNAHANRGASVSFQQEGGFLSDLGLMSLYQKFRRRLWTLWFLLLFMPLACSAVSFVSAKQYSGVLEVTPTSIGTMNSSPASGMGSLLGGSLFGASLGGPSSDPVFKLYIESWQSEWLASTIANRPDLLRQIFPKQWSDRDKAWKKPSGPIAWISSFARDALSIGRPWNPPNADSVHDYLSAHVRVENSNAMTITKIIVQDSDPELANTILRMGHQTISDHLRVVFQARAQQNVNYLTGKLHEEQATDLREALIQQLQQEQKLLMLALSRTEFAALPLGRHVTDKPTSPRPIEVLLLGVLISMTLTIGVVLFVDFLHWPLTLSGLWRQRREVVLSLLNVWRH